MRKITISQVVAFVVLSGIAICLGVTSAALFLGGIALGDFRGVVLVLGGVVSIYLWLFVVYRLFLHFSPLESGVQFNGSRGEFSAQVNILFYLVFFNALVRTHFIPVPLMRFVYIALGARLGANTYSAGALLDPPLTEIGHNCIIGHDAVLFAHAIEGDRFALSKIRIGNNVTIGAKAIVMSGVTIEDGAVVSAGAVVPKNTKIGSGERWGGVPARRLP